MPREHEELIAELKAAPDIESALEIAFDGLQREFNAACARLAERKAGAIAVQFREDIPELISSIIGHSEIRKAKPFSTPPAPAPQAPPSVRPRGLQPTPARAVGAASSVVQPTTKK